MSRRSLLLPALLVCLLIPGLSPGQEGDGIVQKLYENALQLLRGGKPEEALKGFQQIYDTYGKTPQAPDALFQAATFHYPAAGIEDLGAAGRDRIEKAFPLLERIRRDYGASPRAAEALFRLGLLGLEPENPKGSPDQAYAAFTAIANVYTGSPILGDALYGAAVSQMRSGAFEEAAEDLSRFVEQVPKHRSVPRARLLLGACLARSGDPARAMEAYQTLREKHPGAPEADLALERLTLLHRLRILPAAGIAVSYLPDETYSAPLATLGIRSVAALAMGPRGELLIADGKLGLVLSIDPKGRPAGKIPFEGPTAVAFDRRGEVMIAGGGKILVGKKQQPLTGPEGSPGKPLREAVGLAGDRDGYVYAADAKSGEVYLYGRSIDFRGVLHRSANGRIAALRTGMENQIYILDSKEKTLSIYAGGKPVSRIRLGESPAKISAPIALAVDDLGDLYVVDGDAGRVVILDPAGQKILATLQGERGKGGLSAPEQIEVDHQGRIYVYDRRADAILRFR